MSFMQQKSSHWRLTCGFENYGIDYRDYMRGRNTDVDVMTLAGYAICARVELINVRGHVGRNINVPFFQEKAMALHIDSADVFCDYNGSLGSVTSEDNFGLYVNKNSDFRCTESPTGTTQLWFGTYL